MNQLLNVMLTVPKGAWAACGFIYKNAERLGIHEAANMAVGIALRDVTRNRDGKFNFAPFSFFVNRPVRCHS